MTDDQRSVSQDGFVSSQSVSGVDCFATTGDTAPGPTMSQNNEQQSTRMSSSDEYSNSGSYVIRVPSNSMQPASPMFCHHQQQQQQQQHSRNSPYAIHQQQVATTTTTAATTGMDGGAMPAANCGGPMGGSPMMQRMSIDMPGQPQQMMMMMGGSPIPGCPMPNVSAFQHYMPNAFHNGKIFSSGHNMLINPQNPNAPPVPVCGRCQKETKDNDDLVLCESGCNFWYHRQCVGLSEAAFKLLRHEIYAEWVCDSCVALKNVPPVKIKS